MFEIVTPIDLRPMAATGVPPGDIVIALAFAVAATAVAAAAAAAAAAVVASTFGGGGVGVCDIVALLGKSWVWLNCVNTKVSFVWWKYEIKWLFLLTKQACTRHARQDIVFWAARRKRAEIAHGMTLRHPY
jgi:hypothetical protein